MRGCGARSAPLTRGETEVPDGSCELAKGPLPGSELTLLPWREGFRETSDTPLPSRTVSDSYCSMEGHFLPENEIGGLR